MQYFILLLTLIPFAMSCGTDNATPSSVEIEYIFPEENSLHEGTWLQWPHHFEYGTEFRERLDPTWVAITKELVSSEKVHVIAYNQTEKERIIKLLESENIELNQVDFQLFETDDFWVRDNGPIYTFNLKGELVIQDWGFNGWGNKASYRKCNAIPEKIAAAQNSQLVDLNKIMINEGGSTEMDGNGTLLACKSSILNDNRNHGMSQKDAEDIFKHYLGVTNFIWIEGRPGLEITDQHIDGFARFANSETIVTMSQDDLLAFDVLQNDINWLYDAKNKDGERYKFVALPLTKNNVSTTYGKDLGYKGSYCNFYIANTKVLVPSYSDENDSVAIQILQDLYPDRTVVGIDCRNVYEHGGMIHCITQQQPAE